MMKLSTIEIEDAVYEIIVENLSLNINEISNETSFSRDLKTTNLDVLAILMNIQQYFNIEFSELEINSIDTIQDTINAIQDNLRKINNR